jgi:NADH:ubiquinone oxidoreductase subunit 2 (subunit N)
MSMPLESFFSGSKGMPPENVFHGKFFHHHDYWQRLHIWDRVMIIISSMLGATLLATFIYWVIEPPPVIIELQLLPV